MNMTLANTIHEPELRRILANSPMPGWVKVAYLREPDFFKASAVQGTEVQTMVCKSNDSLLGFGTRALKPMYLNGKPQLFGYLGGLRALPEGRALLAVFRAYRYLKELHGDGQVPAYITTIMEDNTLAKRVLTSRRAGLPVYQDAGQYVTYAINVNRFRGCGQQGFSIRRALPEDLDTLLCFYAEHSHHHQFYPVLERDMFDSDYLHGLDISDWLLAFSGDRLIGALAIWDQSAFRQFRIMGYQQPISMTRPILNLGIRAGGFSPLPAKGHDLQVRFAAFICTASQDPAILHDLLAAALYELRSSGVHYLSFGLHEQDERHDAVKGFFRMTYRSRVYLVHWDDGSRFCNDLLERPPFLEAGSL